MELVERKEEEMGEVRLVAAGCRCGEELVVILELLLIMLHRMTILINMIGTGKDDQSSW